MASKTVTAPSGVGNAPIFNPNATVTNVKGASTTALKTIALVNDVIAALQVLATAQGGALQNELTLLAGQLQGASTTMSNAVAGN